MATLEDEIKDLKEKNNELAQKVQYWKMTAAQRDDEKLALMKEINELRLKLSRLRNNGGFQAQKLDAALQAASEKAISHLVSASSEIAKSMEIAKAYMRDRQELDAQSPRWSSIGGTPRADKSDRVHRVPPMMMGGQPIQPVVALSRTTLNTSNPWTESSNSNQNRSLTERAVPMHMLQDVYIPLTRIDVSDLPNSNMDTDTETNIPDDSVVSVEERRLDDELTETDDSDGHISEEDECDACKLQTVEEENVTRPVGIEPCRLRLHINPRFEYLDRLYKEEAARRAAERAAEQATQQASQQATQQENAQDSQIQTQPEIQQDIVQENPLEGPSWLLDDTPTNSKDQTPKSRVNLEPDSTTELDNSCQKTEDNTEAESSPAAAREFSPTVRRRKRTSSPAPLATPRQHHYSPRPPSCRRNSTSGRVLKVLVAKMRLDGSEGESSPPKRSRSPQHSLVSLDAPSPNGATDSRVIVLETRNASGRESHDGDQSARVASMAATHNSQDGRDADRTRLGQDDSVRGRATDEHEPRRGNTQNRESSHQRRGRATVVTAQESQESRDSVVVSRSRVLSHNSHDSRDSDSGSGGAGDSVCEGRTRRTRKPITYKEKPLNRKLRR